MLSPLRPGQQEALNAFEEHFYVSHEDKGILSACCGFGKTRLCYEIIKKCIGKGEERFIIATSRVKLLSAAVIQMKNWFKKEDIKATVYRIGGSDLPKIRVKELMDKKDVRLHFKPTSGEKNVVVLITTYKSSFKIKDGLENEPTAQPDLIIFDEAHNTTGRKGKYHQDLMKVVSEKKLFMTATPLELLFKNKDNVGGDYLGEFINSMHNVETYGKIFYEYTFRDGINDKIIVDFMCITLGKDPDKEEIKNSRIK